MNIIEDIKKDIEARNQLRISFGVNSPDLDKLLEEQLKRLDELETIIQKCLTDEQRIRQAETDEARNKSTAALQPFLDKYNIRTESAQPSVSFAPEVIVKEEAPAVEINENQEDKIFMLINEQEYNSVPKYLKGRMLLADLNAILSSIDSFMTEKIALTSKPLKSLKNTDKNRVLAWREQDVSKCEGHIWMTETDLKSILADKLKTQLKNALPVLRHLQIIKEIRTKQALLICPYF